MNHYTRKASLITALDLSQTLSRIARQASKPIVADLIEYVRSRPEGPTNFGWMLMAVNVGRMEKLETVKTRLTNSIPRWNEAAARGHWSALNHPGRERTAQTVLDLIDEFLTVESA
jgi:hypothetical protein